MKKIVTTSGRRPPRRGKLPLLIAVAVALVALAVVINSSLVARRPSPDTPGSTPVSAPAAPVASTEARPATSDTTPTASVTTAAPAATPDTKPTSLDAAPAVSDAPKAPAKKPAVEPRPQLGVDPDDVFDNRVENVLERLTRQGARPSGAPRLNLTDEEILDYLKKPVEIFDDDDEATAAAKERTAQFKTEALKFIEEGGTFSQYLRDLAAQANELAGTRRDVQDEALRLADTEGREACEAYLAKMNPELEALGLKPVVFAPKFFEMRAKRLAHLREVEEAKAKERESK